MAYFTRVISRGAYREINLLSIFQTTTLTRTSPAYRVNAHTHGQWWGCSVVGAKTGERDGEEGRPVFTLHYDAYQTFEEADHDVCFVDKYRLVHLEDGAEMTWKQEGEEMNREAVMASLADEKVNLQEVRQLLATSARDSRGVRFLVGPDLPLVPPSIVVLIVVTSKRVWRADGGMPV